MACRQLAAHVLGVNGAMQERLSVQTALQADTALRILGSRTRYSSVMTA